jgi:hypothetical protein
MSGASLQSPPQNVKRGATGARKDVGVPDYGEGSGVMSVSCFIVLGDLYAGIVPVHVTNSSY